MDHVGGETHDGEGNRIRRDERPSMDRAALAARDSSEESLQEDLYITIGNVLMVSFSIFLSILFSNNIYFPFQLPYFVSFFLVRATLVIHLFREL